MRSRLALEAVPSPGRVVPAGCPAGYIKSCVVVFASVVARRVAVGLGIHGPEPEHRP